MSKFNDFDNENDMVEYGNGYPRSSGGGSFSTVIILIVTFVGGLLLTSGFFELIGADIDDVSGFFLVLVWIVSTVGIGAASIAIDDFIRR